MIMTLMTDAPMMCFRYDYYDCDIAYVCDVLHGMISMTVVMTLSIMCSMV
jgi:hypothetical protein